MYNDELMHYGVPGMRWGQRRAQKRAAINRYRSEYNRQMAGKSGLSKAYSKITGADKIYAETRYNMSKSKPNNHHSKTPVKPQSTKNNNSEKMKTVRKNVKNKASKTTIQKSKKQIDNGKAIAQVLFKNPMAETANQTANYTNLALQMSPEYRRKYM